MERIIEFERLLINAVCKEKENINGQFAVMLSGGLDSSLIAAISQPDLTLTCSLSFGEKYDEFTYAKTVVKHLKLNHQVVEVKREGFEEKLRSGVLAIGKPIPHFSIYPLYLLFAKAKEMGTKHVMMGDGADELLGGYTRNLITKLILDLYDLPELQNYASLLKTIIGSPIELYSKVTNPRRSVEELMPYWDDKRDVVSNMNYVDLKLQMECQTEMVEGIARAFDIQVHSPFLNRTLVDFCLSLPAEYKIRGSTTKWIERQVAQKYLPLAIVERKQKMGGPLVPVNIWMNWMSRGEFDKTEYLKYQENILNERRE